MFESIEEPVLDRIETIPPRTLTVWLFPVPVNLCHVGFLCFCGAFVVGEGGRWAHHWRECARKKRENGSWKKSMGHSALLADGLIFGPLIIQKVPEEDVGERPGSADK